LLSPQAKNWLDSESPLGDLANMVSLGVAIEWGERRLVLAGDIENGDGGPYSGGSPPGLVGGSGPEMDQVKVNA
jgi:hypothetical protein